jgi:hypothetical protein
VWSWVGSVTAGELAGFCVPLLAAAMVAQRPTTVLVPALVLAGAGEGAILGWSQARVLQRRCRRLSVPRWTGLTSLAAALAWFLGLLPSATADITEAWPTPLLVIAGGVVAMSLLLVLGVAQWWELRRHVPDAVRWIGITAGAWAVALTAFLAVSTPLWHEGQSGLEATAVGVLGGLLMASTMAVVTGLFAVRLTFPDARAVRLTFPPDR